MSTGVNANPDTIYVSGRTGSTDYHLRDDCPALSRCDNIRERPFTQRPLRAGLCDRCEVAMMDHEEIAQQAKRAVSNPHERKALLLLAIAGWSTNELAMTFQCSGEAIRRVVKEQQPGFYE